MKKFLLMSLVIITCFVTGCGCEKKVEDNKIKFSMGPFELKMGDLESRTISDSIKLSDTNFNVTDEGTIYSTEITNTSDKEVKIAELHIIVRNSQGQEIIKFISDIENLAALETKGVQTSVDYKLEDYKTIEYKIIE